MPKLKYTNKNNDIPKSNLFVRLFQKLIWILLWPFFHPLISIPILALAYFIPTLIGAKPAEVHIWYWHKIQNIFAPVSQKGKAIIAEAGKSLSIPDFSFLDNQENSNKSKVIDTQTPQQVRRQMFDKASQAEVAVRVDVMAEQNIASQPTNENIVPINETEKVVAFEEQPVAPVEVFEETKPELPKTPTPRTIKTEPDLIYLSTPQEFNGSAYVINANEISIGGNNIFLYGIYVNPRSREGTLGKQFLQDLIGNEPVHCIAPAYTREGVATGICYVGKISLNHTMVNSGYSKNVSLAPL